MTNYTSNTYKVKRNILNFSNKISKALSKPYRKFVADITYGMLASHSCLLTDIVHHFMNPLKRLILLNVLLDI